LHHDFLDTGYFDEYAGILPVLARTFTPDLSYGLFFLDAADDAPGLRAYVDVLLQASTKRPVLQCTRTAGRIAWLKRNYPSTNVFLLRNPWDQWYSYKVDFSISATPRVIYSQASLPQALQDVAAANGFSAVQGRDLVEQGWYALLHPLAPEADYALFFGLWLFAFVTGQAECELVLDMDEASRCAESRSAASEALARIGLGRIDLSDCNVHRMAFQAKELDFYRGIEEQVLAIFAIHSDERPLLLARQYLDRERESSFGSPDATLASTLKDASRLRSALAMKGQQAVQLADALHEKIAEQAAEVDRQTAELSAIKASRAWKLAQRLHQVRAALLPPGSRRARLMERLSQLVGKLDPSER
ncbi:MAG: hypothetical protein ACM3QS_13760, partial [Bacteroidota bacterium]